MGGELAVSKALDLIMNTRCFTRIKHIFVAGGDPSISHVVHDCVIEQDWILWNDSDSIT